MKVCHSTTQNCEKHTDRDRARQWNSIDWKKIRSTVNRLQIRIAKATQEENWNLVKRLSYLLTHSYSAKLLAIRIVTGNKGKRTPGIDGELWKSASDKMRAAMSLTDHQYRAQPLRRIYIPNQVKIQNALSRFQPCTTGLFRHSTVWLSSQSQRLRQIPDHLDFDSFDRHRTHLSMRFSVCQGKTRIPGFWREIFVDVLTQLPMIGSWRIYPWISRFLPNF